MNNSKNIESHQVDNRKVIFAIQDLKWDFSRNGGASLQLNNIINALRIRGYTITVVSSSPKKIVNVESDTILSRPATLDFTQKWWFRYIESFFRKLQSILKLPWFQIFDSLRFLDALILNFQDYDIFHERNHMYGFGCALASRILNKPYVLSVDADFLLEHDYSGIYHSGLERFIANYTSSFNYKQADVIICVTATTKKKLIRDWALDPQKIVVIPNAANDFTTPSPVSIECVRSKYGLLNNNIVLFVGNFWPWHGVEDLIKAFSIVIKKQKNSILLLVGDGITRLTAENLAQSLGLGDNVIFTGSVDHNAINAYLEIADVAVAPYPEMAIEFWGAPLKVFEYMAAGKAIVASNIGQISEYLDHGKAGKLVEPGNIKEIAEAIQDLLNNPDERNKFSVSARDRARQHFTWQNYSDKLETVYDRVLSAHND